MLLREALQDHEGRLARGGEESGKQRGTEGTMKGCKDDERKGKGLKEG